MLTLAKQIIYGSKEDLTQSLYRVDNVNVIDEYGFTPLIETTIVDDIEKAKLILECGADPNMQDLTGGTALHWAVENSNLDLCRLLLNHGANANVYTHASEAPLVKALLRNNEPLKDLLTEHSGNLTFAQDFIFTKLLGHRYELKGYVDIVDPNNEFTEVNFEGFFLEFSVGLILNSLQEFKYNYGAKKLKPYFEKLEVIIEALWVAAELVKYQQYQIKLEKFQTRINQLLDFPLLILPIAFDGHAITLIKFKGYLIKCDRRKDDLQINGITIYKIRKLSKFNKDLMKFLLYEKKPEKFIEKDLPKLLELKHIARLMIEPQSTGNCSWSNVEACLPACFLLLDVQKIPEGIIDYDVKAIKVFRHWREWDRNRAMHFFKQEFPTASPARKACIAAVLAAIFFQRLSYRKEKDLKIAREILPILKTPDYDYILENYFELYYNQKQTRAGENLTRLIEATEDFI